MLPNFLIAGAEKAGTTWLYDVLTRHPDIYMPDVKEVHFFNRFDSNLVEIDNYANRGRGWYEAHFTDRTGETAMGEATPMYICDPHAPQRIRDTLPDAKLLFSLRNPVSRTYSHYRMARAKTHLHEDLETLIAADDPRLMRRGLYAAQLARWYDLFPAGQIHVVFFEELTSDPATHLARILRFLGVDDGPAADLAQTEKSNAAATYRSATFYNTSVRVARALRNSPLTRGLARQMKRAGLYDRFKQMNRKEETYEPLPDQQRNALRDYFRADVKQLAPLLGRPSLPWPEFSE